MKPIPSPSVDLKEVTFDDDDLSLFQIDDLQLKADAVRNSILPKLNLLMNHSILRVRQIFDVEVFDDSHSAQSPNFRNRRVSDVKVNYNWCIAALTGKRAKEKWQGLKRNDGRNVQVVPFEFGYVLTSLGLKLVLFNQSSLKLSDQSWTKLFRFLAEHEGEIQTLCCWSKVSPILYTGDGCGPFDSLGIRYRWMIKTKRFDVHRLFESHTFEAPIHEEAISTLVNAFVYLFPLYDSFVQVAKGRPIRFEPLVERLAVWWKEDTGHLSKEPVAAIHDSILQDALLKAKQQAENRTRVMPSIRWQVFQRDNWRCVSCGRSADDGIVLHVDHILPRSKGGLNALENYQTLCSICNLGKSNRDETDLRDKTFR